MTSDVLAQARSMIFSCFARRGTTITAPPGRTLLHQGREIDRVFLITDGYLKMSYFRKEKTEAIVCIRSVGTIVGCNAAILGAPSDLTVTSLTSCLLQSLFITDFQQSISETAKQSAIVTLLAMEVREQIERALDLILCPAQQRLAKVIIDLGVEESHLRSSPALRLPSMLKRRDLSALVGVTPVHLSRLLARFEEKGLIARRKGWVFIVDCPALREIAQRTWASPWCDNSWVPSSNVSRAAIADRVQRAGS